MREHNGGGGRTPGRFDNAVAGGISTLGAESSEELLAIIDNAAREAKTNAVLVRDGTLDGLLYAVRTDGYGYDPYDHLGKYFFTTGAG